MNKYSITAIVISIVAILFAGYAISLRQNPPQGAFAAPGFNIFARPTHTATSTHTTMPVLLMSTNTSRVYGLIENDSDTVMYLYFGGFQDPVSASTTVNPNEGVRVNANGGSYEILPENMYYGPIWATSTAASKNILITEK